MKISMKQANLMLKSQIVHEYPWLHDLLVEYGKLTIEDVSDEHQHDFLHVVPHILKQCAEEWKGSEQVAHPVEDLGSERMPCGLCGTPNRYIYYIQNRITGKTLNVGSDCVEEFIDTDLLREGKSKGQLLRKAKRIRRLSVINNRFPGIDRMVTSWDNDLDRFQVVIPQRIEAPYTAAGERLSEIYYDYLDEKYDEDIFEEIESILSQHGAFVADMEAYKESVINEPFVATKRIEAWLADRHDFTTIDLLKKDGFIATKTISRIWERSFVQKIQPKINGLLHSLPVNLVGLDFDYNALVLETDNPRIRLLCPYEKFFTYFGALLFGEKTVADLSFQNLIKISSVTEPGEIEQLIKHIRTSIRSSKISIAINNDSVSRNEIDLIDNSTDLVVIDNLRNFAYEFKGIAFRLLKPTLKDLERYVEELPGKRYTRKELREIRREVREEFGRR